MNQTERTTTWIGVALLAAELAGCTKPATTPSPVPTDPAMTDNWDIGYSVGSDSADLEGIKHLTSANGTYAVAYRVRPHPLPLNEPFAIDLMIFDNNDGRVVTDAQVSVDARMPHHRHGMVVEPKVTFNENGWTIEGMQFHMPGRWELYFDITRRGRTERAQDVIVLE